MSLYHITTRHIFCCAFWDLIVAAMSAITQNSPPVHLYCEIRAFMSMSIGRLSLEHCPRNRQERCQACLWNACGVTTADAVGIGIHLTHNLLQIRDMHNLHLQQSPPF